MPTYERLLQAGLDLFHKHGIHPVGLDRILQQAGVTKTTFYNHFESKEDFSCAVINRFGEEIHSRIHRQIGPSCSFDFKGHLLEVFDAWDELFESKAFRGCMLIGASVASGDEHDPARQVAIQHKQTLLHAYEEMARSVGLRNPDQFAIQFGVLVDGAIVARQLYGDRTAVDEARKMAEHLIDEALADRELQLQ